MRLQVEPMDRHGELVLRDAKTLYEILRENFTWVNRPKIVNGSQRPQR